MRIIVQDVRLDTIKKGLRKSAQFYPGHASFRVLSAETKPGDPNVIQVVWFSERDV